MPGQQPGHHKTGPANLLEDGCHSGSEAAEEDGRSAVLDLKRERHRERIEHACTDHRRRYQCDCVPANADMPCAEPQPERAVSRRSIDESGQEQPRDARAREHREYGWQEFPLGLPIAADQ